MQVFFIDFSYVVALLGQSVVLIPCTLAMSLCCSIFHPGIIGICEQFHLAPPFTSPARYPPCPPCDPIWSILSCSCQLHPSCGSHVPIFPSLVLLPFPFFPLPPLFFYFSISLFYFIFRFLFLNVCCVPVLSVL